MTTSQLWSDLSRTLFAEIDETFLERFRRPGQPNNRLAAWDPLDSTSRYFKFLLLNVATRKPPEFFDCYTTIGPTSLGQPVTVRVQGQDINIDHLLAVEEVLFLKSALDTAHLRHVTEIGAGFGRTAQALLMHEVALEQYTIIDLPELLALSSAYLAQVLPPETYSKLHFIPANDPQTIANLKADLVINIDSFQEMPEETIAAYMAAPIANAGHFYCKNPIGKYDPADVNIKVEQATDTNEVFSLGRCRNKISIFDDQQLAAARADYLDAYRPGPAWQVLNHMPLDIFPYYHHVVYRNADAGT